MAAYVEAQIIPSIARTEKFLPWDGQDGETPTGAPDPPENAATFANRSFADFHGFGLGNNSPTSSTNGTDTNLPRYMN
ncbi:hypothetical protein GAO09_21580 [Rhizobiales bacterium RZME27]|uniref:Uncharacterized protein n=1 Tax=Endobacterium cereale TaxID=2663029 RepID=A0A6A8AIK9_9HYPH|nr:hypothetical protein [Endobacterium cereale]MEB2844218.1 hypothetical protein [Endobacterium cereale]MQY48631.1 hypothetical protein [Endobacterium cereale]